MFGRFPNSRVPRWPLSLGGLSGKLIVVMALIVIGTCSALSWYFIHAQISVMTTELLRNGTLLVSNLAATMRYSVIAGDAPRLEQLMQGVMTHDYVAYAIVRSKNGQILTANGKGTWHSVIQRGETPAVPAEAHLSVKDMDHTDNLRVYSVQLLRGKPVVVPETISVLGMLATLFSSSDEGVFYHLSFPITGGTFPVDEQGILDLMFSRDQEPPEAGSPVPDSVYGLVELGLTTGHTKEMLYRSVVQILTMTVIIIVVGLVMMIVLARRITTPLRALQIMATQVASGHLDVVLPPASSDEIGDLTRGFNSMAAALKDHEQSLLEMNRTLEDRVQVRTQELEQANRQLTELNRLKTSLLSTASHELRTPLTSMKGYVENLLDGVNGFLGGEQKDILRRVLDNIQRLRGMIDDLLNVALLKAGHSPLQAEAVVLQPLIEEVLNDLHHFAATQQVALTSHVPQGLPPVLGDPDKLRQIFTNLIHNAIKFNAPGGQIRITAQQTGLDRVEICVEDSGSGICAAEFENIFLPFYRSPSVKNATQGSGMGLTIVKQLVDIHHGSISVESTPGQGARFSVRLPFTPN